MFPRSEETPHEQAQYAILRNLTKLKEVPGENQQQASLSVIAVVAQRMCLLSTWKTDAIPCGHMSPCNRESLHNLILHNHQ